MDENGEIKKKSGSITNFKENEDGIAKEEILSFCPKCGRKI